MTAPAPDPGARLRSALRQAFRVAGKDAQLQADRAAAQAMELLAHAEGRPLSRHERRRYARLARRHLDCLTRAQQLTVCRHMADGLALLSPEELELQP